MSSKPATTKPVKKKDVTTSSESSSASSSASSSSEDESTKKKKVPPPKKPTPQPKKKVASSSSEASSSSASDSEEDKKPKKKAAAPAPKKKPAAKKTVSSSDEDSDSDDEKPKVAATKQSKKSKAADKLLAATATAVPSKKPAPKKEVGNAFAGLDDESEDADSESDDEPKKGKKSATTSEDEAEDKKKVTAAKGKKGKATEAPKKDDADDLDAILNDLSIAPAGGATDESKMTKAQLKRLRQKQKQEAEKLAPPSEAPATTPTAAAPKEEKKKPEKEAAAKPGKGNKAVEAIKEKLRLQKEEEERRIKAEQDRLAAIEAERIRLEQEAKQAAEDKIKRQKIRAETREKLRAEGKLLTPSERAAQAKREAYLKQLAASGAVLPAALLQKQASPTEASTGSGESPTDDTAVADKKDSKKESKKDQHKKKSAFGKRLEAQKEADRIRAERHASEDQSRKEQKEEEERRKKEDAELSAKAAKVLAEIDAEAAALDEPEQVEVEEKSEDEEPVVDSWEDADSDEDRRKATEKEARRAAKLQEKIAREKVREAKRVELAKKREEVLKAREAELQEVKKQRQVIDDQRKKKAEEAKKAQEEQERHEASVAGGFETAIDNNASSSSAADDSSSKSSKRNENLRSPIACILGHVDTGKTKILDNIRQTSVQAHEAGGITQQIGATFMPRANILSRVEALNKFLGKDLKMDMPGLLVIDTPGHESFTNLRSRGSNLCDIAILVVDIMHGLEPQTIESINLLKQRKTPFVIALNKIDRCYGWKTQPNAPFQVTYNAQSDSTKSEFQKRCAESIVLMAQQGLNCVPYYENTDFRKWISVVPTSAITGEGIPDLLMLLVQLTQNMMNERLSYVSELSCTVLEVKVVEGLGTTIDVILVNGVLHEGDTIVVCGLNGPIVTTIRALLTPPPMHEIRVKSDYVHHKQVKAAMGVKISAQGLENAIAGSSLLVCGKKDDIEELKDEVQGDLATILSKVDKSGQGVAVQASTLGSLEALLTFLGEMKIPVSCISIGPVYKKDVMKAAVMLEKRPEFGVMLCFDVKVSPDAQKIADEMGVKIFTADIIYHLFDKCTKWMEEIKEKKRSESAEVAVFPVVLDILPNAIFNVKSPIVLGVRVAEGVARIGTPICVPSKNFLYIGKITGIQKNHVDFTEAKKGEEFACKIEQAKTDTQVVFGRQFDATSQLVSKISRESIDLLKANFKDDLSEAEWKLVVKLKKVFDIM